MKTLSFVKQALAVALLISAAQVTAMAPDTTTPAATEAPVVPPAKTTSTTSATKDKEPTVGYMTRAWNGVKAAPRAGRGLVQFPARFTAGQLAKLSVPYYGTKEEAQGNTPAVKGKCWTRTLGDVTDAVKSKLESKYFVTAGADNVKKYTTLGNISAHTGWFVAGAAIYAGLVYGAYKLYKKFAQPEEVAVEANKEDAEPTTEEVVVVSETTAEPAPAKRSAQSYVYNPAA